MGARARISVCARWVSRRLRAFAATVSFTPSGAGGVLSFSLLLVIAQPPIEGRIPSWRLLRSKRGPVVYARNVKARRLAGRARKHFRRTDKPSVVFRWLAQTASPKSRKAIRRMFTLVDFPSGRKWLLKEIVRDEVVFGTGSVPRFGKTA